MDVGIDIERARTVHDVDQICERFFSAPEVDIFRNIGVAQQQQAFFRCWTAKEAFVKATGEGLSRPLDSFSVVFSPGETLHLASIDDNKESALNWHLIELEPPEPDYHVAMAIRSGRSRHVDVARFQWIE
jgi:4'-phosphopantetheinyl transferase